MNPRTALDRLDFLLVLDAILEHRTITRAAQVLGVSQSALSHALTRLRTRFRDPLFVRVGAVMLPTPLVVRLGEPLRRSLQIVRDEILDAPRFDPATSTRSFKLCVNEIGALLLIPKILTALRHHAPHASVEPVVIPRAELVSSLETGHVDLAVGHYPGMGAGTYQQLLFRRNYVGIVRKNHPTLKGPLTTQQFFKTPLIRCSATTAIDAWLDKRFAAAHRTKITVIDTPYVMSLATLAGATDWLAFVPAELVSIMETVAPVHVVELPFQGPVLDIKQHWHRLQKADDANRFLRHVVYEALHE